MLRTRGRETCWNQQSRNRQPLIKVRAEKSHRERKPSHQQLLASGELAPGQCRWSSGNRCWWYLRPSFHRISCATSSLFPGAKAHRAWTSEHVSKLAIFQSGIMISGSCNCKGSRHLTSVHVTRHMHAGASRQRLHVRRAKHCRRSKRPVNPSAMLGMFQRKEKTKIIRCGAPVLRKVSRSVLSSAIIYYSKSACTMPALPGLGLPSRLSYCHTVVLRRQQRRYQTRCLAQKSCMSWLPRWSQRCVRRLE